MDVVAQIIAMHCCIKTYRGDIQAMAKPVQEIAIMSQMAATSTMGGLSTGNHRRQRERKRQFICSCIKVIRFVTMIDTTQN